MPPLDVTARYQLLLLPNHSCSLVLRSDHVRASSRASLRTVQFRRSATGGFLRTPVHKSFRTGGSLPQHRTSTTGLLQGGLDYVQQRILRPAALGPASPTPTTAVDGCATNTTVAQLLRLANLQSSTRYHLTGG